MPLNPHRDTYLYVNPAMPAGIRIGLSCPMPFGLMPIRSRRMGAEIQARRMYLAYHP